MIDKLNNELKDLGLNISDCVAEYGDNSRYLTESGGMKVKGVYVAKGDPPYGLIVYEGTSIVIEELKKIAGKNEISLRHKLPSTNTFKIFKKGKDSKDYMIDKRHIYDPITGMLNKKF